MAVPAARSAQPSPTPHRSRRPPEAGSKEAVGWTLLGAGLAALLWGIAWIGFQFESHLAFAVVLTLLLLVLPRERGDGWLVLLPLGGWVAWAAFYLFA